MTMENHSLSLEKWVALSAALEALHLQEASSSEGDENGVPGCIDPPAHGAKVEAKLAYAERACKVALLVLRRLMTGNIRDTTEENSTNGVARRRSLQVVDDDVSIETFSVRFFPSNQGGDQSVSTQETIERVLSHLNTITSRGNLHGSTVGEAEIKCALDNVIDVASTVDDWHAGKQSVDIFRKVGILLYQLFARGESPELCRKERGDSACGNSQEKEEMKENEGQSPRKQIRLSGVGESLSEKDVPVSLCRLVSDLIDPDENDGTSFVSLDEVFEEVKQILDRPDIFFHDVNWLDFSSGLIGRSDEMQRLHEEAAAVQMSAGELANRLVLLKGYPGAGKSYLASNIQGEISESGWLCVHTKFDRFVQNPLLTIASSFDELLASLVEEGDEENLQILQNLEAVMSSSAIVTLSEWLPSLRQLFPHILRRVISDEDLVSLADDNQRRRRNNDMTSSSESAQSRLHYIFRKFVSALSSPDRPLLIFLDDLQWADNSCLDLISSLLLDFNHINQFGLANDTPQCFLVMGSYRENEVDSTHRLSSYLETFERSNTLQVTSIQLNGIAKSDTNLMISEMLGLPLRLTKALADAVQAKTLGNPLYIHAFMQSLVKEKLLVNSVAKKRWIWDIEAIQSVSIQGSIAEVLSRKISYIPHDTQEALKVMSTFGSQISEEYIQHLYPLAEKQQEFRDRLNSAVDESVIEKIGSKYKFVHDMVQQAVYELMSPKERAECHFQNGAKMISALSCCVDSHEELGLITFTAIDQINIAKSFGVTDSSMCTQFAELNLKAGESSMDKFNFMSGLSYIEHGLSFLSKESKWSSRNYDLSRSLHEAACLACYVNALPAKANEYIAELLENAQCLEHKLKAYYVMVKNLTSSGEIQQAVKKTFEVLIELGETFPTEVTPEIIQQELSNTKSLLNNLTEKSILSSPKLTDDKKLWAIKFMNSFSGPLSITNSQMGPLIACRMVQRSSQYGYCCESAFGLLGYGQAQISVFEDVDEGYRWGKIALSLLESLGGKGYLPKMRCLFSSYVSIWKEPFQASSNVLLYTHSDAMMVGDVEYASISAFFYCRQCLVCGQNLLLAEKECKAIASKMKQLNQIQMCYGQVNTYTFILKLNGNYDKVNPFPEIFDGKIANEEELLNRALSSGKRINAKGILSNRFQIAFWLGDFEEAAKLSEQASPVPKMSFMEIYHTFCEGLTAFQLARRSSSSIASKWMTIGEEAVTRFRFYEKCSTWNYENKLFLLEAEYHQCNQEEDKAAAKYKASIASAQEHRFVHEEALALEFYGDFLRVTRREDESKEKYANARVCYEKWGAHAIIPRIEEKIGQIQGTK